MLKHIYTALKGFLMGAANVIPGVSGGTIALLTGIYNELVEAIASLTLGSTWKSLFKGQFKSFWQSVHGPFILALGIGIVLSIVSLAKLMTIVFDRWPVQTWSFFFGLILASAVVMFKGIKGWKPVYLMWVVIGLALGVGISLIPEPEVAANSAMGAVAMPSFGEMGYIFLCGAVSICTMILPGVSGSFVLLLMGRYEYIMNAISNLLAMKDVAANLTILCCFGLGCVLGILAFAKFLHWLLAKWEKPTMTLLLGFIVGSLVKVWPWGNAEAMAVCADGNLHIIGAVVFCAIGVALVVALDLFSGKKA